MMGMHMMADACRAWMRLRFVMMDYGTSYRRRWKAICSAHRAQPGIGSRHRQN